MQHRGQIQNRAYELQKDATFCGSRNVAEAPTIFGRKSRQPCTILDLTPQLQLAPPLRAYAVRRSRFVGNATHSSTVASSDSAAPVMNAAAGDTRVQMSPNNTLAARVPMPSTAL